MAKKQAKGAKRPQRKPSTALVRRPRASVARPIDAAAVTSAMVLGDPIMPAQFVGTLKLSATQIAALRRPVEDDEIEWKPAVKDGPPVIPYLSHNGYRDRLDAAFGLGGWGMAPVGSPKQIEGTVYVPYALVVAGVPRIYTWGEQAIHKMTYGDALEGAKSNAITRCGKELGIARELWSKRFLEGLKRRAGRDDRRSDVRGDDRVGVGWSGTTWPEERRREQPQGHTHAKSGAPISDKQRQRLAVIVRNSGRDDREVDAWLKQLGYGDRREITRDDYDFVWKAVEAPGELPERRK